MLQTGMSGRSEFHSFFDNRRRQNIFRALFDGYYDGVHQEQVVFDTNRGWCSKIAALDQLFPNAKIICCVRPIPEIIDSIERILHANALEASRLVNFESTTNIYSRADILNAPPSGLIGSAYAGLKEAYFGPFGAKLILITYDSLSRRPGETMQAIYDFIDEKPFKHDFNNVVFDTPDYDIGLGLVGLHRVRKTVDLQERESLLPPDLAKRYETSAFWADSTQSTRCENIV
jgi:sulfotransferase